MDNKEIYKKTLTFSLRRFLWDLGSVIVLIIFTAAGLRFILAISIIPFSSLEYHVNKNNLRNVS